MKKNTITAKEFRKQNKLSANQLTGMIVGYLRKNKCVVYRVNNHGLFRVGDAARLLFQLWKQGLPLTVKNISETLIKCFNKNPHGIKGIPDICGYRRSDGKAIYIEVKVGKDFLRPDQKSFLQDAEKAGCLVFVAKDFDSFLRDWRITVQKKN